MMKDCLQFLIEPAKKLKIRLKVQIHSALGSLQSAEFKCSGSVTILLSPPGVSSAGEAGEEGAAGGESVIHHGVGSRTQ